MCYRVLSTLSPSWPKPGTINWFIWASGITGWYNDSISSNVIKVKTKNNNINNNNPQSTMGPELLSKQVPQTYIQLVTFFLKSSKLQDVPTHEDQKRWRKPPGHLCINNKTCSRQHLPVSCLRFFWQRIIWPRFHRPRNRQPQHIYDIQKNIGGSCWLRKYEKCVGWATKSCTFETSGLLR